MHNITFFHRVCGLDYPKDKVILHVFPRTKTIPNMGHFVMKLETYLRIHKIPFQVNDKQLLHFVDISF
jgi:hypothetical protein